MVTVVGWLLFFALVYWACCWYSRMMKLDKASYVDPEKVRQARASAYLQHDLMTFDQGHWEAEYWAEVEKHKNGS